MGVYKIIYNQSCAFLHHKLNLTVYFLFVILCVQRFELAMKLKDLKTAYQLAQQIDVRVSIAYNQ